MECKFCHREFDNGLSECPYCHCMVDIEPQKLTATEKNTFDGVTIDVADGTVHEGSNLTEEAGAENEETSEAGSSGSQSTGSGFHVYHLGGGLLWTGLILLAILALFFFLLPTFLLVGVAIAGVYLVSRLFF